MTITICYHICRQIQNDDERSACLKIRKQVFVEEQELFSDTDVDQHDKDAVHIAAFFNDKIIGTVRIYKEEESEKNTADLVEATEYVNKIATMITNAGHHFNMGVRSYYFGLVVLSWFISPILFIFMSFLVVCVLYRREFMSKTLILLT